MGDTVGSMRRRTWLSFAGVSLTTVAITCSPDFDTTRRPTMHADTVGGDVFEIICARVDASENPADVDFTRARPVCAGQTLAPCMMPNTNGGVGPRVCHLGARRTEIVSALDRLVPPSMYRQMDQYLLNILPLYGPENGRFGMNITVTAPDGTQVPAEDLLPRTTRSVTTLLRSLARSEETVAALSRMSFRQGMRQQNLSLGMTQAMMSYPQLGTVVERTMNLLRADRPGHPAGAGNALLNILMDVARSEMTVAAPAPPEDQQRGTTLDAVMDLMFRGDDGLITNKPRYIVRRDTVGMPRVTHIGGALPMPFVMGPNGNAQSENGQFTANGRVLNVPAPFDYPGSPMVTRDTQGRVVTAAGPLYEYVDLDRTVLGALIRDSRPLVNPEKNTALRLARGASVLFGPRRMAETPQSGTVPCPSDEDASRMCRLPSVQYNSFDASMGSAPILDLINAAGYVLGHPDTDPALATAESLMTNNAGLLARNLAAILEIKRVSDMTPRAVMSPTANMWDDIVDVVRDIAAKPGLLEDVMTAMQDPASEQWLRTLGVMATRRDRIEPDWSSRATMNASLASRTLTQPVDYSRPDTQGLMVNAQGIASYNAQMENRSAMQRFLHLVYDLDGVRLCNKNGAQVVALGISIPGTYAECEMFEVPDAAVFYVQAVLGEASIGLKPGFLRLVQGIGPALFDATLQSGTEIDGFDTTPSPEAINRMVFAPDSRRTAMLRGMIDPPRTRDGRPVREVHPGTIFTWETNNFYAGLRPLARAFNRYEGGLKLLIRLFSALHLHWATEGNGMQYQRANPMNAFYSHMSGAREYEPILGAAMAGDIPAASRELINLLPRINVGNGRNGLQAMAALARVIVMPNAVTGVRYRDGRTTTTRSDGMTRIDNPSLFFLFADAFNAMDTQFATNMEAKTAWESARSELVDTFLGTTGSGAQTTFSNRQIPIVSRLAIQWGRERLNAHRMQGDLDAWSRSFARRAGETTSGPTFSAAYDLLTVMDTDPMTRRAIGDLLYYMLDDSAANSDNNMGLTLSTLGDTLQMLRVDSDIDPFLHGLAPAFQRRVTSPDGPEIPDGTVPAVLRLLDQMRDVDTDRVMDRLMPNMVARSSANSNDAPISVIADAIAENSRTTPGDRGPLSRDDVRKVFGEVDSFFSDRSRGFEQFYYIVQHRRL